MDWIDCEPKTVYLRDCKFNQNNPYIQGHQGRWDNKFDDGGRSVLIGPIVVPLAALADYVKPARVDVCVGLQVVYFLSVDYIKASFESSE